MSDSPRDKTKPPRTKQPSKATVPNVFATTMFLPNAPINRNSAFAIWLMHTSKTNCLQNLQLQVFSKIQKK